MFDAFKHKYEAAGLIQREALKRLIVAWQPDPTIEFIEQLDQILDELYQHERIRTRERKGLERVRRAELRRRQRKGRRRAKGH